MSRCDCQWGSRARARRSGLLWQPAACGPWSGPAIVWGMIASPNGRVRFHPMEVSTARAACHPAPGSPPPSELEARGAAIEGAAIRIGHELVGGWCVRERWCSHRRYHKGTTQISRRNGLEQLDDRMPTMRSGVHAQGFSWRVLPVRTVPMPAVRSLRLPA